MADVTQDPEAWARLGAKIRERREEMGWSRRSLSGVAGVSEKSIQVAEEGRTPRARWPQSLRLIETALRWEPGSMLQILEGGEPELARILFDEGALFPHVDREGAEALPERADQEVLFPDAGIQRLHELAHERGEEFVTAHTRSLALAKLPKSLRVALQEVLQFGRKAVSYGADPEVAERYEEAVEALLMDVIGRRLEYAGYSPASDPGHLALWNAAMRMDPVLRREREERMRAEERERRRIAERMESVQRAAVREVSVRAADLEVIREIRKLAERIEQVAEKVESKVEESANE